MSQIKITNVQPSDYERIVQINAEEVVHTSPMDVQRLTELHGYSAYHKIIEVDGCVAAFLLAMSNNSAYRNDNYDWFTSRYDSFLYIDRIVVNAEYAGLRLGSLLYKDIFQYAKDECISVVCCEYNVIPSNIPSQNFHDKFGFKEVGQQWLNNKTKKVSLQAATVC
jgi:predicted GNAT superfamily acetyltransferase